MENIFCHRRFDNFYRKDSGGMHERVFWDLDILFISHVFSYHFFLKHIWPLPLTFPNVTYRPLKFNIEPENNGPLQKGEVKKITNFGGLIALGTGINQHLHLVDPLEFEGKMRAAYITFSAARCCVWIWASRAWRHWRRWNLWEDALLWCTWNCDFLAASNLVEAFGRMRCAEIFESEWRNVFFLNKFSGLGGIQLRNFFFTHFGILTTPKKSAA